MFRLIEKFHMNIQYNEDVKYEYIHKSSFKVTDNGPRFLLSLTYKKTFLH